MKTNKNIKIALSITALLIIICTIIGISTNKEVETTIVTAESFEDFSTYNVSDIYIKVCTKSHKIDRFLLLKGCFLLKSIS